MKIFGLVPILTYMIIWPKEMEVWLKELYIFSIFYNLSTLVFFWKRYYGSILYIKEGEEKKSSLISNIKDFGAPAPSFKFNCKCCEASSSKDAAVGIWMEWSSRPVGRSDLEPPVIWVRAHSFILRLLLTVAAFLTSFSRKKSPQTCTLQK